MTVKVRARSMIGQLLLYCLALTGAGIGFIDHRRHAAEQHHDHRDGRRPVQRRRFRRHDPDQLGHASPRVVLGYLVVLATLALLGEVILGYGYWMLVARGAIITNADSLTSVRATAEDLALHGEGLADALNVGAY